MLTKIKSNASSYQSSARRRTERESIGSQRYSSTDLDFNLSNLKLPGIEDTRNEMKQKLKQKEQQLQQDLAKPQLDSSPPSMHKKLPKIAINFVK